MTIYLSLGANLNSAFGTPDQALYASIALLEARGVRVKAFSSIWKSAPVPISDQPWYYNAVCEGDTHHTAHELLSIVNNVEEAAGRVRTVRNAPRVLDIDILTYHDQTIEGQLQIPHPRLHERAFVLYPLQEISPNWIHPVQNKNIEQLIQEMPKGQEIQRIENSAPENLDKTTEGQKHG